MSDRAIDALKDVPPNVRRAYEKQLRKAWRFYFTITEDTYRIENVIPHPK